LEKRAIEENLDELRALARTARFENAKQRTLVEEIQQRLGS
jgi:hypothetical protein